MRRAIRAARRVRVGKSCCISGSRWSCPIWSGSRHFHIEMAAGFDDDAEALKPNTIALANAIIPQLR